MKNIIWQSFEEGEYPTDITDMTQVLLFRESDNFLKVDYAKYIENDGYSRTSEYTFDFYSIINLPTTS